MKTKKNFIENLIKKMTIKEKIGQTIQYGTLTDENISQIKEGMVGSFLNGKGAKYLNHLQKIAVEESRLGIPLLFGDDVIHGFRTIFPIPLAESCTWDLDLIKKSAELAGKEANAYGINWIFAPMVDITRDPRWGRIAEGAGEDHYLGKKIAAARVEGFQTKNINQYPTTASCPKHFIGYGASIGGRDYNNVDFSENYLRTYYLPPFLEAFEAGALTTMCSFNDLFSIPLSANKKMLRDLLKNEFGFNGLVVSDWQSIEETISYKVSENKKEAAKKGLIAGVDMDMHSNIYRDYLETIIKENPELEELLDDAVKRILSVKYDLGLFEHPYVDESLESNVTLSTENRTHARQIASHSIVLLENKNHLLPLEDKSQKIALIGPFGSDKENHLGCWSWKGQVEDVISIAEGIKNHNKNIQLMIEKGCDFVSTETHSIDQAVELAKTCDMIILGLGESRDYSGEAHNRVNLNLPGLQDMLVERISELNKPTIAIVASGRPLTIGLLKNKVDAILWTWHLGVEAGNAISDILFGNVNPSGKLTVTIPKHVGQVPLYYNHKSIGRPDFPKYLDCDDLPLYPFGYGLSYTQYHYSNLKLFEKEIKAGDNINLSVDVTNIGDIPGEEIVQVYFKDQCSSITTAVKQLCAFKKVMINTGETKTITFTIDSKEFMLFNDNHEYVIEPGQFTIYIGPSSTIGLETELTIY